MVNRSADSVRGPGAALLVVMLHVGRKQLLQVTSAKHHDAIEALGSDGADPSLGMGFRFRGSPGRSDDLDSLSREDLVEHGSEAVVPVVYEKADRFRSVLASLGEIASDLGAPSEVGRTVGHPTDQHTPALQFDEEEHVEGLQSDRLDGEEVTGDDRGGLGAHELAPRVPVWARTGLDGEDAADARRRDLDADLLELALDSLVASAVVLP